MAQAVNEEKNTWESCEIVPDVIGKAPAGAVEAVYTRKGKESGRVDGNSMGKELTPTQVFAQPTLKWESEKDALYTVVLTDPDAPSRKDPKYREWVHWLVLNVSGNDIDKGDVVIEYVGSAPPKDTDLHRYCLFVYKQSSKIDVSKCKQDKLISVGGGGANRGKWKLATFIENNKASYANNQVPVAGVFYQAKFDDFVPDIYKWLGGNLKIEA